MFVRKKHNKSETISIQIIDKSTGQYRVVKSLGASKDPKRIEYLWRQAHVLIPELTGQTSFDFQTDNDKAVDQYMSNTNSLKVRVVGPEIVFGSLFDEIGFNKVEDELFRHLVITRLVYPGSKRKTIDYLQRYQGVTLQKDEIYRFLDKLSNRYKETVEHISFAYTRKVLGGNIGVVFYDMTTLYFESEDEDDLRKTGFSKDGKHQNPQIFLGLLVGLKGYLTNSDLKPEFVIQNYNNLWQIEKAFRISKTDLRIRTIYHRLRERIEAHISVAFSAYTIYKELERVLYADNAPISARRAADITQTIYALDFELPDSRQKKVIEIGLSEEQKYLIQLFR